MAATNFHIIDNEIFYFGYRVAVLTQDAPVTYQSRFQSEIIEGFDTDCSDVYDEGYADGYRDAEEEFDR